MKKLALIALLSLLPAFPVAAEPICYMRTASGQSLDLTGLCSGSGVDYVAPVVQASPDSWQMIARDLDGDRYLGNRGSIYHFKRVTQNGISRIDFSVRIERPNGSRRRTMRLSAYCNEGVLRTGRTPNTRSDTIPTNGSIGQSLLDWACS